MDRAPFVVVHRNVAGVNKTCPGYHFNCDTYLRLVRRYKYERASGRRRSRYVNLLRSAFSGLRAYTTGEMRNCIGHAHN